MFYGILAGPYLSCLSVSVSTYLVLSLLIFSAKWKNYGSCFGGAKKKRLSTSSKQFWRWLDFRVVSGVLLLFCLASSLCSVICYLLIVLSCDALALSYECFLVVLFVVSDVLRLFFVQTRIHDALWTHNLIFVANAGCLKSA
jgi:hypothetical protein